MPWLSVQVKADAVKNNLTKFGNGLPRAVAEPLRDAVEKARAFMARPAPHPRYPIHWDSERQRRWWFANNVSPYVRTGNYERNWKVVQNPSSQRARYGYSLVNDTPYAKYVGGNAYGYGQSQIHAGRWAVLAAVFSKFIGRLPQAVRESVMIFAEKSGLRRR